MRLFEFVIAIVGIVLTYSAFMAILRSRRSRPDPKEAEMEADMQADRERLESLEERVAVLERIVTDRKSSLHRQFSDLD
jgi:hypothetical protein